VLAGLGLAGASAAATPVSVGGIFLVFAKVGSVLFGSGYVLLAFLRAELVERLHWLSEAQLIDAVAVGQITPGPVFTTATFIGYLLGGWIGERLDFLTRLPPVSPGPGSWPTLPGRCAAGRVPGAASR